MPISKYSVLLCISPLKDRSASSGLPVAGVASRGSAPVLGWAHALDGALATRAWDNTVALAVCSVMGSLRIGPSARGGGVLAAALGCDAGTTTARDSCRSAAHMGWLGPPCLKRFQEPLIAGLCAMETGYACCACTGRHCAGRAGGAAALAVGGAEFCLTAGSSCCPGLMTLQRGVRVAVLSMLRLENGTGS